MRVLVCGGRDYLDYDNVDWVLGSMHEQTAITLIIQGGAKGADFLARVFVYLVGISCMEYSADWKKYGKKAGPIRNQQMLDKGKPDMVVAFPGGTGTADMVRRAKEAGVKVVEVEE